MTTAARPAVHLYPPLSLSPPFSHFSSSSNKSTQLHDAFIGHARHRRDVIGCSETSLLFFSRPRCEGWPCTPWTYCLHLSLSSVILMDSSTESPVHVLMLSIQAVRGLPRLRAPGIVPCIISCSRQLPCFLESLSETRTSIIDQHGTRRHAVADRHR